MSSPVVGLTGNIACGKSQVSAFLSEWGVAVVDADQIAREVVAPGSDGLQEIVDAFGVDVLDENATLNRPALGAIVFGDDAKRASLNSILHPKIALRSAEKILSLQSSGAPYIIYDAALLVENESYRQFSSLVVVTANTEIQLARLMARDDLTESEAEARVRSQLAQEAKAAVADYVIDNSGELTELRQRCLEVHNALCTELSQA